MRHLLRQLRPARLLAAAALAVALGWTASLAHGTLIPTPSTLPPPFQEIQADPGGGSVWQGRIPNSFVPGASRPTVVYLPPGYSTTARYPVVFLLQGFRGSPYQFVSGLPLPTVADGLIDSGRLAPFVAVIPPAGLTARYDGEWAGPWEEYVVDDVVPWADEHLPVETGARSQTLAGLSAGGFGAVDIGLRHPRLFGTLESWSGSFTAPHDGPLATADAAQLAAHDPSMLAQREAALVRTLRTRFFLSAGTADVQAVDGARAFDAELAALRIPHDLVIGPGGHDGRFWTWQLAAALEYAVPARGDLAQDTGAAASSGAGAVLRTTHTGLPRSHSGSRPRKSLS